MSEDKLTRLSRIFSFEKKLREAKNIVELRYIITNELRTITGQHPILKLATKSVAGFKIREGMPLGLTVTLRREKMYAFLEQFIDVHLAQICSILFQYCPFATVLLQYCLESKLIGYA